VGLAARRPAPTATLCKRARRGYQWGKWARVIRFSRVPALAGAAMAFRQIIRMAS